jgi:hypothetical protein
MIIISPPSITGANTLGDITMNLLSNPSAELGIVGLTISSLVTLLFYIVISFNKREDKRTQSFQDTICHIHDMHKNERCEWRTDANLRQSQTNEALKELSNAIQDLIKNDTSIKV